MEKQKIKIFGEEFPDFSEEFMKVLEFDPEELWKGATFNRIKTMATIVLGTTGMGKSTFLKSVQKSLQDYYKNYGGVLPIYTNEVSLAEFMTYAMQVADRFGLKDKPSIIMLSFDDATAVEIKPEEIKKFFSMRHVIEKETGMQEGAIYTFMVTHDWYSLSKVFRRYADNLVTLSIPPLDEYSRNHLKRTIGEGAMKVLESIRKKAMKLDRYKGKAIVKLPYTPDEFDTNIGIVEFKPVNVQPIQIKYGESINIIADIKNSILYIPHAESIAEDVDEAQRRFDRQTKSNAERQQKWRDKTKQRKEKLKIELAKRALKAKVEPTVVATAV